jgi:translation initiation factor IF-2
VSVEVRRKRTYMHRGVLEEQARAEQDKNRARDRRPHALRSSARETSVRRRARRKRRVAARKKKHGFGRGRSSAARGRRSAPRARRRTHAAALRSRPKREATMRSANVRRSRRVSCATSARAAAVVEKRTTTRVASADQVRPRRAARRARGSGRRRKKKTWIASAPAPWRSRRQHAFEKPTAPVVEKW